MFSDEAFYTTDGGVPPLVLPDNIKIFPKRRSAQTRTPQARRRWLWKSWAKTLPPAKPRPILKPCSKKSTSFKTGQSVQIKLSDDLPSRKGVV